MAQFRNYIVRSTLGAGALVVGTILAGCADNDPTAPLGTTTMPTATLPTPGSPTTGADEDRVTPAAARQLCDMIAPEIDNWRAQGPTVGKVSFNGTVQNWATRNDGLNDEVLRDKSIIDTVTTQTCADVRQRAIEVLQVPDLASALVGDR
ncbi:hypothetical protein NDR87_32630 [Nocardia sp. CDC159]|uniref:Lipoprotein n=1 Tax=Nocardia pulmonis TaxID=2951408 RepID=A0A9X2J1M1_9NOCA|nr:MULTISPECIES: hypothetical protein [Nocardia]MCM6778240.1 hypothetical protein [Nocardia pulmonis]MCM6791129.1 hypothetical protein [Nocardia sp. CDC159]